MLRLPMTIAGRAVWTSDEMKVTDPSGEIVRGNTVEDHTVEQLHDPWRRGLDRDYMSIDGDLLPRNSVGRMRLEEGGADTNKW
jgi:hypothetical protein